MSPLSVCATAIATTVTTSLHYFPFYAVQRALVACAELKDKKLRRWRRSAMPEATFVRDRNGDVA
jgi:hypothetical protein